MASFQLELVTPDKVLFSGAVDQVDVPGLDGDFGVLAGHAPVVAILKPGFLVVHEGGKKHRIVVTGGFVEINPDGMTVLADFAGGEEDFDRAMIAAAIKETEQQMKQTQPGTELDRLLERLDHFRQLDTHLQTTAMH